MAVVPYEVAQFIPFTRSTGITSTGVTGVAKTSTPNRAVGWWNYNAGAVSEIVVIDTTVPDTPTFGAKATLTGSGPGIGRTRVVPGSQLLLTEGPANSTINCHTWDATTLAITAQTAYAAPAGPLKIFPFSSTRAVLLWPTLTGGVVPAGTVNLNWRLVNLTSTGIGSTVASGTYAVVTSGGMPLAHDIFRIDNSRALVLLHSTTNSAVVIEDTGSTIVFGTAVDYLHDRTSPTNLAFGEGGDGTFYSGAGISMPAATIRHVTVSGTTINVSSSLSGAVAGGRWTLYPFDPANLVSLTNFAAAGGLPAGGVTIVDRATGTPQNTPAIITGLPSAHRSVANITPRHMYTAIWVGVFNAETPRVHILSAAGLPPLVTGGWAVGMVRMGAN
jgi:hypothetical protein